jgi:hypothetical protein
MKIRFQHKCRLLISSNIGGAIRRSKRAVEMKNGSDLAASEPFLLSALNPGTALQEPAKRDI